jgi:hypothetical protein
VLWATRPGDAGRGPFGGGVRIWILGVSAALVTLGAWLEVSSRRTHPGHGFPWLFAFSVLCFAINVGVILAHRAAG